MYFDIDIFEKNNSIIQNDKIYFIMNNESIQCEFPYKNYSDLVADIKKIKIQKLTTNKDLDQNFEKYRKTFPINLAFDYAFISEKKVPALTTVVDKYIELSLNKNKDGSYTEKDFLGKTFSIEYKSIYARLYKGYFSFIREYATFTYIRDYFRNQNINVFINREDDYKGRIDIGIIYKKHLFIIDTSIKTKRSDKFEERKVNGIRRNMDKANEQLMKKYNCDTIHRILLKADLKDKNSTYKCGEINLYNINILKNICDNIIKEIKNT